MKELIHLSLLLAPLLVDGSSGDNCQESSSTLYGCPWTLNISCNQQKNAWQLQCKKHNDQLNLSFTCSDKPQNKDVFQFNVTSSETCHLRKDCKNSCSNNGNACNNNFITISSRNNSSYKIQLRGNKCWLKVTQTADNETGISLTFHSERQSWIKALQYCRNIRSSLVQITNQTVEEAVSDILKENDLDEGVWVGLERSIFGTNIEWMWTSGIRATYPEWNSSHYVDPLNNHCGKIVLVRNPDKVKLVDEDCHHPLPFICQDKLGL